MINTPEHNRRVTNLAAWALSDKNHSTMIGRSLIVTKKTKMTSEDMQELLDWANYTVSLSEKEPPE